MGLLDEQEALERVAAALHAVLPEAAETIQLEVDALGRFATMGAYVTPESAAPGGRVAPGRHTTTAVMHLRDVMTRPETGTWFSAEFVLTRGQGMQTRFNYDDAPDVDTQLSSADFEYEQQHAPRSPEHQPDWYRDGLSAK